MQSKSNALNNIDRFLYSEFFPVLTAIFVFFCYLTHLQFVGLAVLVVFACYILIRNYDITPLIPLTFCFVCLFRDFEAVKSVTLYIILAPFIVSLIYHFIKFPLKKPVLGKLFFPFFLLTLALFLSGLLSQYVSLYVYGLLYAVTVGPLLWFAYFLFLNYVRPPKNFNLKTYTAFSVIVSVFIMCLCYLLVSVENNINSSVFTLNGNIGFGNTNNVGAAILIAVPACCYLIVKTKKIVSLFIAILFFMFSIMLLHCDGGTGVLFVFIPFLLVFTYLRLDSAYKRKFFILSLIIILCIATVCLILTITQDYAFFEENFFSRFDDSGRTPLYELAINIFKQNPIFGAGLGFSDTGVYGDYSPTNDALRIFNFHSTIFQVMGSMGIMGLIAYAVYFYKRYEIITDYNYSFNLFVYFSFTLFECYGIVDTCEFNIVPCMLIMTVFLTVTEVVNNSPHKEQYSVKRTLTFKELQNPEQ